MEVVDIALIVALDEEYQTIRRTLGTTPTSSFERTHLFNLPIAKHPGKQVTMAVHVIGEMGLVPTTSATDSVLDRFNPSWLVSIGLSGQLSNDCYLGDVVLSTECDLAYSEARLSIDKTEFAGKIHEVLGLKDFVKAVDLSKYLQCRELHLPTAAQSELVQRRLWRKFPRVHAGITCSTDFVVDDPKRKSELLQKNRRFLCTDMESAAMVAAARRRGYGGRLAIIRAISDPADGTKKAIDKLAGSGTIRTHAMRNATTVLQHAVIEPFTGDPSSLQYVERPLVSEAIARVKDLNERLKQSSDRVSVVAGIDADASRMGHDEEIASYVYRARIAKSTSDIPKPLAREIASLDAEPAVSFFVALHVMRALTKNYEAEPEYLLPLTHVHTYEVNQFCKAFLESAQRKGVLNRLLDRISAAYETAGRAELDPAAKSNLHAHLCYLLGRVRDDQSRARANAMLEAWRDRLVSANADKKKSSAGRRQFGASISTLERLSREQLLQYRTIQISLVQLGGLAESDRYIQSCLASSRLDAQNRGFHLEYYGDIDYDPAQPLNNEDRLDPMPRTLRTLGDKLLNAFATGERYQLRDIELYTVISLLRSRLQQGKLTEPDRNRGHEILSKASWMSGVERFKILLSRVSSDLVNPKFHPLEIVDELFELKKLLRAGWSARGRRVANPESVASHTFGGMVLIELFLPETRSAESRRFGSQYSKEKVQRLFLKHDWAEAMIGDLLPDQKTEITGNSEEEAFRKIGLSFIYSPYVNRTIYEDWLAFERGASINAQLARDVDQLDNLQQLLLESAADPQCIPDRASWIKYIEARIRTDWGREMFEFLVARG